MKNRKLRLIVLVPHRDAGKIVDEYKQKLFANGFSLAYAFPSLIPLMITKKPYTMAGLKDTAIYLKKMILIDNEKGKFVPYEKAETIEIAPNIMLGGYAFSLSLDDFSSIMKKDDVPLPRLVLGLALLKSAEAERFLQFTKDNPLPPVLFRACSVSNMVYRFAENGAFSWEIGHPVWLQKHYSLSISSGDK